MSGTNVRVVEAEGSTTQRLGILEIAMLSEGRPSATPTKKERSG